MPDETRPLDGVRIALVGSNLPKLEEHAVRLRDWGAVASPRTVLSELAAAAERCTVVVVFVDEFADEAIRTRVDGIERWREGPTLVVVTDRSPQAWSLTVERVRPAVVVEGSEWATRLLEIVPSR
jgi:vacuolar-type H+-ATPase subunit F/Vma7